MQLGYREQHNKAENTRQLRLTMDLAGSLSDIIKGLLSLQRDRYHVPAYT
jgi:hypothetical protein